jgi:hypothetical protein
MIVGPWMVSEVEFENRYQARFVTLGLGSRAIAVSLQEFSEDIRLELERMIHNTINHN